MKELKNKLESALKLANIPASISGNTPSELRLEFFKIISQYPANIEDENICSEFYRTSPEALMQDFESPVENLTLEKLEEAIRFSEEELEGEQLGDNLSVTLPDNISGELEYIWYEMVEDEDLDWLETAHEFAKRIMQADLEDPSLDLANHLIISERARILHSCICRAVEGELGEVKRLYSGILEHLF